MERSIYEATRGTTYEGSSLDLEYETRAVRLARKERQLKRRNDRKIALLNDIMPDGERIPTPEELDLFAAEMLAWDRQQAALRRVVS